MRFEFIHSLSELKKKSPTIVIGIVTKTTPTLDTDNTSIITLDTIHVLTTLKGNVKPHQKIDILQEGAWSKSYTPPVLLKKGEVGLFFLQKEDDKEKKISKGVTVYSAVYGYVGMYMLKNLKDFSTLTQAADGQGSADSVAFSRYILSEHDHLPMTITPKDVKKS